MPGYAGFTMEEIRLRGHPVWAEIDLGALRHNIRELDRISGRAEVMAVVKGYAYGHGNPACAGAMLDAGATRLGVARVAEALHLREAGIGAPIHVFTEPPPEAIPELLDNDLIATVYTAPFARALSNAARARGRRVPVHVKLDTGMHRVGLMAHDVPDAVRELRSLPGIGIEGAWSHFAVADVVDHPFNRKQLDLFHELLGHFEGAGVQLTYRHMANSAATLSMPESHFDIVRPGVASYGLWPSAGLTGSADLKPVMSLRARINMVKRLPGGERLSYGLRYELDRESRVATIPAGYADGYDRRLSQKAEVLLKGRRYLVSGTVCMDQFMVDAGDAAVEVGDTATLLGSDGQEAVTAEELAGHIGTINYEVTCRVAARVPRVYIGEADAS
ncbi:MAG TPA: alanine racemase [Actinomycetota bacterium]|jgi:alanine racemase|nr:alanine racemase [Actinomycetota bacterium]